MPIVKAVTSGEPITAAWANSVVSEVNKTQAIDLSSGMSFRNGSRGIKQTLSDPAFQIRYSYGTYTLNAGQIYINGQLVKPTTKQQKAGEETGEATTSSNSYNQYSSLKDWDKNYKYKASSAEDFPIWYIVITSPSVVTSANIGEVEAKLICQSHNAEAPKQPTSENGEEQDTSKTWYCIKINDVINKQVVQLVSGSIYLNNTISLVSGDGILIEAEATTNTYKVNLYVSFIADDGIEITEGYEPQEEDTTTDSGNNSTTEGEEKPKPHPMKVIRIKATNTDMSFIGIDGITIHDEVQNVDVSNENDPVNKWVQKRVITVEHDIKSFIGRDNIKVTEEIITDEVTDPNTGETVTKEKKCVIIQQDKPTKLSFIGEDGITVTQSDEEVTTTDDQGNATTEKVTVVTITGEEVGKFSFIGTDGIKVAQSEEDVTKTDDQGNTITEKMQVVTIGQEDSSKFSFIGIDGITVAQAEETVTKTDDQGNTTTEKMQVVTIGNNNSNEYEFVGKDGVEVTTEESTTTENGKQVKKTKVTIGASVIADVDVDVRGGTNVTVNKTTEGTTQVFTVNTTTPEIEQVSIVAGDGITVTHSSNTYTISATLSGITYDFDPSWFIVTDTTVTINEAKFEEVAASLAPTVTSQITTVATSSIDGVNDCGREGDIMLEINTTGDTASARAWTQW